MSERYVKVATLADLNAKKTMVVKINGKQIVLFRSGDEVLACNNRCPHEGYPLSEGSLTSDCILTCNWHNWKFDLKNGKTLVGGDELRVYPVQLSGDDILLDLTDPPKELGIQKALNNLKASFRRQEYDRMAREIARLEKAGGDPLDAIRHAILWTHDRFEYGMTHAYAGTADWLSLRESPDLSASDRLVPLLESVGHMSWDIMREADYPFTDHKTPFDPVSFLTALEKEEESTAIALLNDALEKEIDLDVIFGLLGAFALSHYAGFGHSAIYVYKCEQLIDRLGRDMASPILKALVRNLIYASREELLPEFRSYGDALALWTEDAPIPDTPLALDGVGAAKAMQHVLSHSGSDPEDLFRILLEQLARNMLYFDADIMDRTDKPVSQNINWLDFSHGITFSNAAFHLCSRDPSLWPRALLQMACFIGRNGAYTDFTQDMDNWFVDQEDVFLGTALYSLLDHANPEFIVSSHQVKLTTAIREEADRESNKNLAPVLAACLNRFLSAPFKRKHTRRTATQSLEFVAREG